MPILDKIHEDGTHTRKVVLLAIATLGIGLQQLGL